MQADAHGASVFMAVSFTDTSQCIFQSERIFDRMIPCLIELYCKCSTFGPHVNLADRAHGTSNLLHHAPNLSPNDEWNYLFSYQSLLHCVACISHDTINSISVATGHRSIAPSSSPWQSHFNSLNHHYLPRNRSLDNGAENLILNKHERKREIAWSTLVRQLVHCPCT